MLWLVVLGVDKSAETNWPAMQLISRNRERRVRTAYPHPIEITVASEICSFVISLKALLAAKYPVGNMSAMRTKALSAMPSVAFMAVESAKGTRTLISVSGMYQMLIQRPHVFCLSSIKSSCAKKLALGTSGRVALLAVEAFSAPSH